MGIIRFVLEAGLVSTAVSVLRRTTGFGIRDMLLTKVQHPYAVKGINMYFDVGESVSQKCLNAHNSLMDATNSTNSPPPTNSPSQKD